MRLVFKPADTGYWILEYPGRVFVAFDPKLNSGYLILDIGYLGGFAVSATISRFSCPNDDGETADVGTTKLQFDGLFLI